MSDHRIAKPSSGMGIKPPDYFTVPLCGKHHREQHANGEYHWWLNRDTDPVVISLALYAVSGDYEAAERIIRQS
jgi:hypothetical protein